MNMKFGINGTGLVQKASVELIVDDADRARADGFSSYWLAEHPTGGFDALTVLALVGARVPDIELGSAIVPTFPRHPMILAGQALTVNEAIDGRLTLGVGLSHKVMMAQLGINSDKPIRHLRDYLSILMPLINTGQVDYEGETLSCKAEIFRVSDKPLSVVTAALGSQTLRVAGSRTQGTILAWVGARTIENHIAPKLFAAADKAKRDKPRIIATLPLCVTDQPDRVRSLVTKNLAMYGELPSYKAMFEREGVAGPGELAIIGNEAEVAERLRQLDQAGVTDFAVSEFTTSKDERSRTREFLCSLLA